MTPVTRFEEWVAPRAIKLLAVISAFMIAAGVGVYVIRLHDVSRIDRLERVIRCQDDRECRAFIHRAIRELLRHPTLGQPLEPKRGESSSPAPAGQPSGPAPAGGIGSSKPPKGGSGGGKPPHHPGGGETPSPAPTPTSPPAATPTPSLLPPQASPKAEPPGLLDPALHEVCSIADHIAHLC